MFFPITPITIKPMKQKNKNDCFVQMSNQLFTNLLVNHNLDLNIKLGHKTINTKVKTIEMDPNMMLIPENILKDFCLPIQDYKFQAIYQPDLLTLELGPVIGLLTDFPSNEEEEPHFRSIHAFCEELHHGITETGGFFYVFSYDQFLNRGYYLINGKWSPFEHPLPDVIYNRIHSRKLEHSEPFKHFRKRLETLLIPLFNERFLSKWEVYNQIFHEKHLFPFLPKTKIYTKEHLYELTQEFETVFIKPVHGSQGRNIMKLKKEEDSQFSLQTSIAALNDRSRNKYLLDEVHQLIKQILHNRFYIVQQGIELVTFESCAVDFRVLCHKNLNNHWQVTSIVARVASENEFVSNIARGGRILRPLNVLHTCLGHKKSIEVLALMKELALETASTISGSSTGITGELGIDIGVDQEGQLWIIEVNSKPSKNFEDGLGKIRPSAKALIQFCTLLAFESTIVKEDH
ncbi:YheC/YheD family protein [Bacillus sp. ISL-40]|uniref:YheC/YheD family endospore coat-associated protein n=1 Tax=unclassified Bacillus (in: firmicutes) TaxID=185979 RepID=UPI001BE7AAA3|nr:MULTISPECIES: YheC/YheD family protein [unclassified Bacillus (in: firmicutes)]MBT2700147.1 YheC/YheD family protein [Bacillus sp. ISL-40]MBT2721891.1 YheC/YheD family protein [Bacillus sp. ISL-46]MBT2740430.1 YheC/YheD family protein [Bacillus sp. ISL-77]